MIKEITYFLWGNLIVISLVTIVVFTVQFSSSWYQTEFQKLNLLPPAGQVENLFGYLKGQQLLNKNFYTEREILHLMDIKKLFEFEKIYGIMTALIVSLLLFILFKTKAFAQGCKILFFGSGYSLAIVGILAIVISSNFDRLFINFHQLLFSNNYWQLDPAVDNLINIFPPALFLDLLKQIFITMILSSIALMVATGTIFVGLKVIHR